MGADEENLRATHIDQLPERIESLPAHERALANQLFQVVATEGRTVPPATMYPWLEQTFGSVEATLRQRIIRVTNRWTFEGAIFNPLRSRRPGSGITSQHTSVPAELLARIEQSIGDDFCDPTNKTPADTFGRVLGRHLLTASNVAKADGWHGVGVFDHHDPLAIDEPLVADILGVAYEWARQAHAVDPDALHLFLLWNCLWRAGASLIHGHVQMTLSHEMPQARVELWRAAAHRYHHETGGDYFADLVAVHRALGLANDSDNVVRFATLTPVKEREVVLLSPVSHDTSFQRALTKLAHPLSAVLDTMLHQQGVYAFNLGVFGPPITGASDEWEGFPLVARFVDRGNPLSPTSDIAALELFGSSVVATDPFDLARAL